ncbi:hypothetical protein HGRIS_001784 [Hohenbuehelia grisea]|uniref:Uncharacterized protein n=1 Tax=Hohenbuehelia grisea TaxID=104357 RepID=A0ABR3JJG7_9AGAR
MVQASTVVFAAVALNAATAYATPVQGELPDGFVPRDYVDQLEVRSEELPDGFVPRDYIDQIEARSSEELPDGFVPRDYIEQLEARAEVEEFEARGLGSFLKPLKKVLPFAPLLTLLPQGNQQPPPQKRELEQISELFARSDLEELDARGLGSLIKPALPVLKKVLPFAPLLTLIPPPHRDQQQPPPKRELDQISELFARSDLEELDARGLGSFLKPALPILKKVAPFAPLLTALPFPHHDDKQKRELEDFAELVARSDLEDLDARGLGSFLKPALPILKKVAPFAPLLTALPFPHHDDKQKREFEDFAELVARSDIEELDARGLGSFLKPALPVLKKVAPFAPLLTLIPPPHHDQPPQQQPPPKREVNEVSELLARSDLEELDARGLGSLLKPALPILKKVAPFAPLLTLIPPPHHDQQQPPPKRELEQVSELLARSDLEELDARGLGSLLKPALPILKKVAPFAPLLTALPFPHHDDSKQKRELEDFASIVARSIVDELEARDVDDLEGRGLGSFLKPLKKIAPFAPLLSLIPPPPAPAPPPPPPHRREVDELDARGLGSFLKPLKKVAPFAPLLSLLPIGQQQQQRRELVEELLARAYGEDVEERDIEERDLDERDVEEREFAQTLSHLLASRGLYGSLDELD